MNAAPKIDGKPTGRNDKGQFTKGNSEGVRFEPGNNANPNGRRNALSDILNDILDEDDGVIKKELATKLVKRARDAKDNEFYMALDRIQDRTEGKSKITIDMIEYKRPEYEGTDPEGYLSDRLSNRQGS